ncbi:hypothetical protein [Enterobacter hormaechei]|uniref:hypothetical protein n=1 Tax=Enterobacter hormaechei TaxID=158836 RepID=UPI003F442F31
MKTKTVAGLLALLSMSAQADNFAIECEGHPVAYLTIEQGEHKLAVIGNPIQYKYTAPDEHYAVKHFTKAEDAVTKTREMFFPVNVESETDNAGFAAIMTHHDGAVVMVLPDGVKLTDCKVKIDDLLGGLN